MAQLGGIGGPLIAQNRVNTTFTSTDMGSRGTEQMVRKQAASLKRLEGSSTMVGKELHGIDKQFQNVNKRMSNLQPTVLGLTNTFNMLALTIGATAAGAVQLSRAYESELVKLQTQLGLTATQVDQLGPKMEKLAKETGRAYHEIAAGMFFIQSAGVRDTAVALDTLSQSAWGAALQMGRTEEIANLLSSAVNQWGSETLAGSRSMDILIKTVKEGKLVAKDLPLALSRLIPLASTLGISFEEINAAVAAFTRTGATATMAATRVQSALAGIIEPTEKARNILADMGLTVTSLQKKVEEQGFMRTLQDLWKEVSPDKEKFSKLIDRLEALPFLFDVAIDRPQMYLDILNEIEDSAGSLADAQGVLAEADFHKQNVGINKLKVAMTDLGDSMRPFLNILAKIVDLFTMLPEWAITAMMAGGLTKMMLSPFGGVKGAVASIKAYGADKREQIANVQEEVKFRGAQARSVATGAGRPKTSFAEWQKDFEKHYGAGYQPPRKRGAINPEDFARFSREHRGMGADYTAREARAEINQMPGAMRREMDDAVQSWKADVQRGKMAGAPAYDPKTWKVTADPTDLYTSRSAAVFKTPEVMHPRSRMADFYRRQVDPKFQREPLMLPAPRVQTVEPVTRWGGYKLPEDWKPYTGFPRGLGGPLDIEFGRGGPLGHMDNRWDEVRREFFEPDRRNWKAYGGYTVPKGELDFERMRQQGLLRLPAGRGFGDINWRPDEPMPTPKERLWSKDQAIKPAWMQRDFQYATFTVRQAIIVGGDGVIPGTHAASRPWLPPQRADYTPSDPSARFTDWRRTGQQPSPYDPTPYGFLPTLKPKPPITPQIASTLGQILNPQNIHLQPGRGRGVFSTPYQTPYQTPLQTPYQSILEPPQTKLMTPLQSPLMTPLQTPLMSGLMTPLQTPLMSPYMRPYQTPYQTPYQSILPVPKPPAPPTPGAPYTYKFPFDYTQALARPKPPMSEERQQGMLRYQAWHAESMRQVGDDIEGSLRKFTPFSDKKISGQMDRFYGSTKKDAGYNVITEGHMAARGMTSLKEIETANKSMMRSQGRLLDAQRAIIIALKASTGFGPQDFRDKSVEQLSKELTQRRIDADPDPYADLLGLDEPETLSDAERKELDRLETEQRREDNRTRRLVLANLATGSGIGLDEDMISKITPRSLAAEADAPKAPDYLTSGDLERLQYQQHAFLRDLLPYSTPAPDPNRERFMQLASDVGGREFDHPFARPIWPMYPALDARELKSANLPDTWAGQPRAIQDLATELLRGEPTAGSQWELARLDRRMGRDYTPSPIIDAQVIPAPPPIDPSDLPQRLPLGSKFGESYAELARARARRERDIRAPFEDRLISREERQQVDAVVNSDKQLQAINRKMGELVRKTPPAPVAPEPKRIAAPKPPPAVSSPAPEAVSYTHLTLPTNREV